MHKVLVPSKHSEYVLRKTNYTKKDQQGNQLGALSITTELDVLFEGLDLQVFNKRNEIPEKIKKDIDSIKEDFCFLVCGHWLNGIEGEDRKDLAGTIRTFLESFKNKSAKNQPALVLKISSATFSVHDREDMLNRIERIKQTIDSDKKLPSVYLLHGDLTIEEMNGLYNHPKIKAMISFTKGEGFGRPLLEFSNTGKPTIASNWSGQVDFLSAYGTMLPGELKQVHPSVVWEDVIMKESQWFTVDYNYAANVLQDVVKNYKKYLEKSRKQTQYIKENFSLDKMHSEFLEIMNEVLDSTFNTLQGQELKQLEELQTYE